MSPSILWKIYDILMEWIVISQRTENMQIKKSHAQKYIALRPWFLIIRWFVISAC